MSDTPRLLFNAEGIDALKKRIESQPWAKSCWETLQARLDRERVKEVILPPRGGNWFHWHASPTTGAALEVGQRVGDWQWEHIDPVSGEIFRGDPSEPAKDFDGCMIRILHYEWCELVRDLGVAYQVTGEFHYAARAREIVMAYADKYLTYPLHNTRGETRIGGGRVGPQTLNEAVWIISICHGVDLIWNTLSAVDRKNIAERMLLPAAREVILPHEMKVHNIQCWKNSAVGLVGYLLEDQDLISQAIDNPVRGYRKQMAEGVTADGQWWEGAWGYHFYTMEAVWPLAEAARNAGLNLYGDALKRMFDGPVTFATPGMKLPAFNDSHEVDLFARGDLYELGYARFKQDAYVSVMAKSDRQNNLALWFGAPDLPAAPHRTWKSRNFVNSGYAILSRGRGVDATWLCCKYGPHGGGHGHPDKLNFVLTAKNKALGLDAGTCKYGLPERAAWYKTTFSHNVLTVDEAEQAPAQGRLRAFGETGGVDCCIAESGPIYEGVRHLRGIALVDEETILFADRVVCTAPRLLDIVYHQRGVWSDIPEGAEWGCPDKPGYRYLQDARARVVSGAVLGLDVGGGLTTSVVLAPGTETELMTATGMGDHLEDRVPVVVFRRRAQETVFVWGISLTGERLDLRSEADGGRVTIWIRGKRLVLTLGDCLYGFGT